MRGLRARGGFEVDLAWQGGRLKTATVHGPTGGGKVRVNCGAQVWNLELRSGETRVLQP